MRTASPAPVTRCIEGLEACGTMKIIENMMRAVKRLACSCSGGGGTLEDKHERTVSCAVVTRLAVSFKLFYARARCMCGLVAVSKIRHFL